MSKLNLILVNLFKWIEEEAQNSQELITAEILDLYDVRDFSASIAAYFNYSYKRQEDYFKFSQKFISEKKTENSYLYPKVLHGKSFNKISTYSEVRWLSLGSSLNNLQGQWTCLIEFFEYQLDRKKELKLNKDQITFLLNMINRMYDDNFKFIFLIFKWVTSLLNKANILFQTNSCQLHNIQPESRQIFNQIAQIIMEEKQYMNTQNNTYKTSHQRWKLYEKNIFLENIKNYIEFDCNSIEFFVDEAEISEQTNIFFNRNFQKYFNSNAKISCHNRYSVSSFYLNRSQQTQDTE